MVIGPTGIGKSTFMNAMLCGSEMMEYDEDMNIVVKESVNPLF